MHELAIAMSVVELAESEMERAGTAGALSEVELEVGSLAGVDTRALRFSLELALLHAGHNAVTIRIVTLEAKARCNGCGRSFEPQGRFAVCPRCGTADVAFLQGWELRLNSLVVE